MMGLSLRPTLATIAPNIPFLETIAAWWLNRTGTSALATAGTGDVLTGMIATLLAQGLTPIDAARVGAFWHGRAGQLAARERPIGVIAGDLPDLLSRAAQPEPAGPGPVRIF